MTSDRPEPFQYDAEVELGTKRHVREPVGESYLGDPVEIPVTIVNGTHDGPTIFLTAAIHGDELNGVKVVQEVADTTDPDRLHGTLVCVHVCNVPAYQAQQRYIPVYDQDLNREFPGRANGNTAQRMAHQLYHRFLAGCDLGLDFHTSTRNRTTMYHTRADLTNPEVERLARAFGSNVVLYGDGEGGSLRSAATADGIPTITVEMGRAHRFQPALIQRALTGVESVLAEYGLRPDEPVHWPGWYTTTTADSEKRWLRAQTGGLVGMEWGRHRWCTTAIRSVRSRITSKPASTSSPHPLPDYSSGSSRIRSRHPDIRSVTSCDSTRRLDSETRDEIEREIERGEFDGYRIRSGDGEWDGDD